MTRIIAGAARGRRLKVPEGATRPTADRVREALFSAIESRLGSLAGAHIADLYAGSGAVGLEALSRGAAHALLVERDRRALEVLKANAASLGLRGAVPVGQDVTRLVAAAPSSAAHAPYDLVYVDPPYDHADTEVEVVLAGLADHGWLAEGALVLVERSRRGAGFLWPDGYEVDRDRSYGDTLVRSALWYGRDA
ncbi:MAG: 16S rRNA (guanine(966)-N(2))-methyltransferase RsmD [Candidatus Nanopelagicales bacterium]